ncbi:MAG: hypothetical protein ACXVB0_00895 [Mucilaginibacter sp.]
MLYRLSLIIIFSFVCNCNTVRAQQSTDTTGSSYDKELTKLEQKAVEKNTDSLGTLITKINFRVKTDNLTDFSEGFIPWIELGKAEKDLKKLMDKNEVVIDATKVIAIIDYPLTKEWRFELISANGFTREQLVKAISEKYHEIYKEEETTASVKTVPADKRTDTYNRNETNGKYGIWGHDLSDLALDSISVYKTDSGDIILSLDIDS